VAADLCQLALFVVAGMLITSAAHRNAEIMAATAVADAVTLVQLKTARMRPSAFAHDIKRRSTGARITKSRE